MTTKKKPSNTKRKQEHSFWENVRLYLSGKSDYQKKTTQIFWGKKFTPLIIFFLLYSFILISNWDNVVFRIITINDSYALSVALVFTFIMFSMLFLNTKFKQFFFGKYSILKQLPFLLGFLYGSFFLWRFLIGLGWNLLPTLLILAMFWLIIQGVRVYDTSRRFASKMEARSLKRYSPFVNLLIAIIPFLILTVLTIGVWSYRYGLVWFTLDIINFLGGDPSKAVLMYSIEMDVILPFLYISLIVIFVFFAVELIMTRMRVENRRMGIFDNFAYSLIVFFMYLYLIYQISLYLVLHSNTQTALGSITGAVSGTSYFFYVEFFISIIFLFRGIRILGNSMGGSILFFNKDSVIMIFLGVVAAQTASRIPIFSGISSQDVGVFRNLIITDHLLIPALIMLFLGITILVYYIRPQKTSMFLRTHKGIVDGEDEQREIIYEFLKREYIRRGEPFPLTDVDAQLISLTGSNKTTIRNIIQRDLDTQYMELHISTVGARKFIEFISIHDSYEKKSDAQDRVKQFMSDRLTQTLTDAEKKDLGVSKGVNSDVEERKSFLSALDTSYKKKTTEPQQKGDLRYIKQIQDKKDAEHKKKDSKKQKKPKD
ncbi:MAG: hypothetical protein EU530_05430 [Promethearchaeota archaeon]|nr:MAG: hypothetical protein EU530_05430 [Candidatus Lokiarchaeota archaeon]